ncbi:hypothetical protein PHLCEN_2v13124 [Hermanssonia centrifuga]|uniref:Uncharacterized protein n=1 Tax=Hermanssonia centrifuga TaxID=98765 RepID=A0A2R6NF59_9APHY|nr:hypothetical protein PHLCEN_2v13124 [Hermanssonia centrifuga]
MSNGGTITYDDRDQVKYTSGPWYPLTATDPDTSAWQDGTLTGVNYGGATFTFTFSGSRVSVYGTLRGMNYTVTTPTESSYSIDGVVKQNYIAPQVTVEQDKVLFFDSGDIGALNHFLSVSVTSATGSFPYYLDFITVVPPPAPVTTSSTPPPPQAPSSSPAAQQPPPSNTPPPAQTETSAAPGTPNSVPSSNKPPTSASPQSASTQSSALVLPPQPGGSTTIIVENGSSVAVQLAPSDTSSSSTSSATPAPGPVQNNSAVSHVKVGPIAGGVVGGVVILIAALALFFLCRRHKKSGNARAKNNDVDFIEGRGMQETGTGNGASGVTPYLLPRDYGTTSAPMVPQQIAAPLAPGSVSGTPQSQPSEKARLALQGPSSFAGPAFLSEHEIRVPPAPVSERSLYSLTSASDYTSNSKTHLLVPRRHIDSPSTGDADVSNHSISSGEHVSSFQLEESQSSPPTASANVPGPSIIHADSGIRFLPRAAGSDDPTYDASSILSPVPSEVPPVYTAR